MSKSKTYQVQLPIAGHVTFEIKANSADEAIRLAFEQDARNGEVTWETLESFGQGNVCHCPSPWNAEASEI